MTKLDSDQMETLGGGICQFYPGQSGNHHPGTDVSVCFNAWLCTVTNEVTGGGISCLLK